VGLEAIFWFGVKDGLFAVRCQTNRIDHQSLQMIHHHAFEIARCAVDMLAFSTGQSLQVVMEKALNHDGTEIPLTYANPSLGALCTAYRLVPGVFEMNQSLSEAFMAIMEDPAYMLALNDLTSTLGGPHRARINCARAVEAIAVAISPEETKKKLRWKSLQMTLNISESYLKVLTDESEGPRHGNYFEQASASDDVLRAKAWIVMNRFVEYLKRHKTKLTEPEFPILL